MTLGREEDGVRTAVWEQKEDDLSRVQPGPEGKQPGFDYSAGCVCERHCVKVK